MPRTTKATVKPYRITRRYTKDSVTKTYTHNYPHLDKAYDSLIALIDESTSYTFVDHLLIAIKPDSTRVTCELRNELKPCIIPLHELIESHTVDPKWVNEHKQS